MTTHALAPELLEKMDAYWRYRQYVRENSMDLPEVRDWKWSSEVLD